MSAYRKAVAALIGAVVLLVMYGWLAGLVGLVTTYAVFRVYNGPVEGSK